MWSTCQPADWHTKIKADWDAGKTRDENFANYKERIVNDLFNALPEDEQEMWRERRDHEHEHGPDPEPNSNRRFWPDNISDEEVIRLNEAVRIQK